MSPAGTSRHCRCGPLCGEHPSPPPAPRTRFPQGNRLPVCFLYGHHEEWPSPAPLGKCYPRHSSAEPTALPRLAGRQPTWTVSLTKPPAPASPQTLAELPRLVLCQKAPGGSHAAPAGDTAPAAAPMLAEHREPPWEEEREREGAGRDCCGDHSAGHHGQGRGTRGGGMKGRADHTWWKLICCHLKGFAQLQRDKVQQRL